MARCYSPRQKEPKFSTLCLHTPHCRFFLKVFSLKTWGSPFPAWKRQTQHLKKGFVFDAKLMLLSQSPSVILSFCHQFNISLNKSLAFCLLFFSVPFTDLNSPLDVRPLSLFPCTAAHFSMLRTKTQTRQKLLSESGTSCGQKLDEDTLVHTNNSTQQAHCVALDYEIPDSHISSSNTNLYVITSDEAQD